MLGVMVSNSTIAAMNIQEPVTQAEVLLFLFQTPLPVRQEGHLLSTLFHTNQKIPPSTHRQHVLSFHWIDQHLELCYFQSLKVRYITFGAKRTHQDIILSHL